MLYGYIRVSTKKQSLERQRLNIIRDYPEAEIYEEKYTGTSLDERRVFQSLLKKLKPGDVIVFDSVSRMSRQAPEGFKLYQDLFNAGIELRFLKEPYINSENYQNAMNINLPSVNDEALKPLLEGLKQTMMLLAEKQFLQAFEQAEKEVKDLSQRTKEGMRASGAGEKITKSRTGKKYQTALSVDVKPKIKELSKDFEGTLTDKRVIEILRISRNTYYKYKKEML